MTMPRPEHPRPDFHRDPWVNLNGVWNFKFDEKLVGEGMRWHQTGSVSQSGSTINVPFPWESQLSGQGRTDFKGAGWYERDLTIPANWKGLDPILHFGAIDWEAHVWINSELVSEHANGYLPFSCNLRDVAAPGETVRLTVRAFDIADASTLVGKQVPRWYTHSSGIWQTVWLEGRHASYVREMPVSPDLEHMQARVQANLKVSRGSQARFEISSPQGLFETVKWEQCVESDGASPELVISIPNARLWTPDDPFLYEIMGTLYIEGQGEVDRVTTYFGMRSFGRAKSGDNPFEFLTLNGEPIYLRGALDQAFYPEGLYSYPSDNAIRRDIELAKEAGLNMLRCHIKINEPRYYYWADKLGILIHYDMPSPDMDSPRMRQICKETIPAMIRRDYNHPSIMLWILFNETWGLANQKTKEGQEWLRSMFKVAQAADSTRLVEDNSSCNYDHVETDVNSWHFYINNYARARAHTQQVVDKTFPGSDFNYIGAGNVQGTEPLMNSEYGGISAAMGDMDISWCFKYLTTDLRRHAKICGYVYTELTDIEWELNGFYKYDRSRKIFGYEEFAEGMSLSDLNAPLFAGLDCPPCQTLARGSVFSAPAFLSNWSEDLSSATLDWQVTLVDRLGLAQVGPSGSLEFVPQRFGVVTAPEPLVFNVGEVEGLATVALYLRDAAGNCRHRNYVNVEISQGMSPRVESVEEGTLVRFGPTDFQNCSWPTPGSAPGGSKTSGNGPGMLEYDVQIPESVDFDNLSRLELRMEIGARAHMGEKLSWPPRNWRQHTPQTMEKQFPAMVEVKLNGFTAQKLHLEDDPADARGVLSHHYDFEPGSYGYLQSIVLTGQELAIVIGTSRDGRLTILLDSLSAVSTRGFSVYGERSGRFPMDPTLIFS